MRADQISTLLADQDHSAGIAVDGIYGSILNYASTAKEWQPHWMVDLEKDCDIRKVKVYHLKPGNKL